MTVPLVAAGQTIAVVAVVAAAAYAFAWTVERWSRRADVSELTRDRIRGRARRGTYVAGVTGPVAVSAFGNTESLPTVATSLAFPGAYVLTVVIIQAGLAPSNDGSRSRVDLARDRVRRNLYLMSYLVPALVGVLLLVTDGVTAVTAVVVGCLVWLGCIALGPYLRRLLGDTRPPPEPVRRRIAAVVDGRDAFRAVRIRDGRFGDEPTVVTSGVGPCRHLFVSPSLVATLSDEEFAAVVAHQLAHSTYRHRLYRAFPLLILGGGALTLFASAAPLWTYLPLGLGAVALEGYVALRCEYAADEYAAKRCTPTAMASALESLVEVQGRGTRIGPFSPSAIDPATRRRIRRLRALD